MTLLKNLIIDQKYAKYLIVKQYLILLQIEFNPISSPLSIAIKLLDNPPKPNSFLKEKASLQFNT